MLKRKLRHINQLNRGQIIQPEIKKKKKKSIPGFVYVVLYFYEL